MCVNKDTDTNEYTLLLIRCVEGVALLHVPDTVTGMCLVITGYQLTPLLLLENSSHH